MSEVEIGKVTHYFSHLHVAAVELTADALHVGDTIHIKGHTSDFQQKVESMQVDGVNVDQARPGQNVGMRVVDHAREHDLVYKVAP